MQNTKFKFVTLVMALFLCLGAMQLQAQLVIGCGIDNNSCQDICQPTVKKVQGFRSGNTLFCSSGISYCAQGCYLPFDDPNSVYNWTVTPNLGSYSVQADFNGFARIQLSPAYNGVPVTVCLQFVVNAPFPYGSCQSNTLCFGPF
jgi:hypothetical protein